MRKPELMVEKGTIFFEKGFSMYVNRVSERFELPEHMHDFIEICYVWEGNGFHYIGDKIIRVTKGDLFFLSVGVSHIFRPTSANPKEPLIIGNCIFDENIYRFLASVLPEEYGMYRFRNVVAEPNCWLQTRDHSGEIGLLFESLLREFNDKQTGYETLLCGLLLQLLIGIERSMNKEEPHFNDNDRMEVITRFIQDRLHEKLTLSAIAHQIGIGVRQLQRIFSELTGVSFSDYLTNERIDRSCRLLSDPSNRFMTILDIASSVGIHDPKRFYSMFKRKMGLTPAAYRTGRKEDRQNESFTSASRSN
ncbi:AraC family transcriptional regulator [Paenibacillus baekrokdamisoli]|uniref:AraC family transcriptional regulator n=1 Tax=Paenibacillus baekrokdamisoli TaxID=1712516 RepID=A0A3G9IV55_9BACL|nr:AraC family transcriptional regulator [Paenibacillus baekrokdamisoli]MBB3070939.1 AraC family L-rhamnose operon transcriptional activator RhaR [Paenibacillus baekrokdamisoli]BBH22122.1 AraC family transcriptional regulator [Paenibacillus baekrokdamisoli]